MIRIALAQLNFHVGNFEWNAEKIVQTIEKAKEQEVNLIVFSELAICGYPPHDLMEQPDFLINTEYWVNKIAMHCFGISVLIGAPVLNPEHAGKKLKNAAIFISNGKMRKIFCKSLLPTYDIFDEYRYFETDTNFSLLELGEFKIAVTICEDIWDKTKVESPFAKSSLYKLSPMEELKKLQPHLAINLSASPFSYTHDKIRHEILTDNSIRHQLPFIYVNQVGGNTDLIFDGASVAMNKGGILVCQLSSFAEDFGIVDFDGANLIPVTKHLAEHFETIQKIYMALILGIKDYFAKTGFSKATLGLSGGIDSAVTLVLASEALGAQNLKVLLMPSEFSSAHSVDDAVLLAKNLGVAYEIIPIQPIMDQFLTSLKEFFLGTSPDITEENLQARIRGTLLMALSNKFGNMLLNTSNKSESATGYGTLYGDMNGGISVLGDVYKTQVYQLANFINREREIIPVNSITKPPSAELRPDQKDSDSLPEYEILDKILFHYIEQNKPADEITAEGFDANLVKKVIRLVNLNEYKRYQAPPGLRVSPKAFGWGRRMPLVAKF